MNDCSLWITVARTDTAFMSQTIPHLVKMCNYPFAEKVLAIDTALLSGEKASRPQIGTLGELRDRCKELLRLGVIDRVVDIDYSEAEIRRIYAKHFNAAGIKATHNWKGYPVYGSMWCIEQARGLYFLHFDSDMLLYQEKGFDWISKGIEIMKDNPDILWARSQAGPQNDDKNMYRDEYKAYKDSQGFYRVGGFSSRCYLLGRKRFESMLPIEALFTSSGALDSWELAVREAVINKSLFGAHIADNKAWTLHPKDRGSEFLKLLPGIIQRIECGDYPAGQAGEYDLKMSLWR